MRRETTRILLSSCWKSFSESGKKVRRTPQMKNCQSFLTLPRTFLSMIPCFSLHGPVLFSPWFRPCTVRSSAEPIFSVKFENKRPVKKHLKRNRKYTIPMPPRRRHELARSRRAVKVLRAVFFFFKAIAGKDRQTSQSAHRYSRRLVVVPTHASRKIVFVFAKKKIYI